MSNPVSLASMRLSAQQAADLVGSNFITTAEWNGWINTYCQQLWEKLVEAYGSDYEVQLPFTITTDGLNDHFALPTDFFKLLGVDLQISPGAAANANQGWVSVWRFNFADRNRYTLPNIQTFYGRTNMKYRLSGGNIFFIPFPSSNQSLRLWYAPKMTALVNDTDTFDDVNGWAEWATLMAAKKALTKEESDTSGIDSLLAIQEERLTHVIENRDAGQPATTVDIWSANGGWLVDGFGHDWGY